MGKGVSALGYFCPQPDICIISPVKALLNVFINFLLCKMGMSHPGGLNVRVSLVFTILLSDKVSTIPMLSAYTYVPAHEG